MSLLYCQLCKAEVTDKMETCPRCGYPIPHKKEKAMSFDAKKWHKRAHNSIAIIGLSLLVAAAGWIAYPNPAMVYIGLIVTFFAFIMFLLSTMFAWLATKS